MKGRVGDVHSLTVFSPSLFKVDNEFETVATQLLKRTQAMLNKYRCLLLEDAMVNSAPKSVCLLHSTGHSYQFRETDSRELNFPSIV